MNRSITRRHRAGLLMMLLLLMVTPPAESAGTPGAGTEQAPEGQSASEAAQALYREGLEHKAVAQALESAATDAEDAERTRLLAEAREAYRAAVKAQGRALKLDLDFYEAANEMGYALRRTGEYAKALGAYNFALEIRPDFYPAIEYRGEAYLSLGRLDEAREAYLTLFRNDLTLAARLLAAMAAQDTGDPAFEDWVAERQKLAAVTPGGTPDTPADW